MGQYRLAIYFRWILGVSIEWAKEDPAIIIMLPFVKIYIGLGKHAYGSNLFE